MATKKVPGYEQAVVPESKITEYLLSLSHPKGRSKAQFFIQFGFTPDDWQQLADALLQHAADNAVASTEDTPFGTKYIVDGGLRTPDGRTPMIRAVWFLEYGQKVPRLATAHPLKRRDYDPGT